MITNRGKGHLPQIVFTSDFHELVRGDLFGDQCVLRYDPHRIVPPAEIADLPITQRPILAFIRFHPTGQSWAGQMRFVPGARLMVDADPTGGGTMVEIRFPISKDCEELECWFSYADGSGTTHWDSGMGKNFWLRFPSHDLELVSAQKDASGHLKLEVDSLPVVDAIDLRWRYTQPAGYLRELCPLESTTLATGRKRWSPPQGAISMASNSPILFDLIYTVGEHKFTDDNEGTWYLVTNS